MYISGFTIIRNAIKMDYPVVESIRSILPLCDEIVVLVGDSDDDTLNLIRSIESPKIRIVESVWDNSLRHGGAVLAHETNKAFALINPAADWAFYLQGDEVIHEKYLPIIKQAMQEHLENKKVEGLLFDYVHFYGSYQYVGDSRRWYRKEIRVIRNDKNIYSYKDAQGFRVRPERKLNVKPIAASVYHYGWVREPQKMLEKQRGFNQFWSNTEYLAKIHDWESFKYDVEIDSLVEFTGTHPAVMTDRIKHQNWQFKFDISKKHYNLRYRLLMWIEKHTGWRVGEYKNYHTI